MRFKRLYNSVMVRGERVIAVSDQIAELIVERYRIAAGAHRGGAGEHRMARFDPAAVSAARLDAVRRGWGVTPDTKVILVVGRMLRRKGHHVVVKAVHRLKQRGLKDFVCVFAGEDQGRTRYTGELWDLVSTTGTSRRGAARRRDRRHAGGLCGRDRRGVGRGPARGPAARDPRGAGDGAPGRRVGPGGRARSRAGAARGSEERMTGLRVPAEDEAALAAALIRLFSLSDSRARRDRARAAAPGSPTISTRRASSARRLRFMPK